VILLATAIMTIGVAIIGSGIFARDEHLVREP
jgi:hypothetical protein